MSEKNKGTKKQGAVRQRNDKARKVPLNRIGDSIVESNDTTNSTGPKAPVKEKK